MGLENVFGTPEKIEPEKQLEVMTTEESVLDDLIAYFERTNKKKKKGLFSREDLGDYFVESQIFLQSYQKLTPEMISKFNKKFGTKKLTDWEQYCFGNFLSALIQTSYEQGFNNFEFDKIETYGFGAFLHGQQDNLIRIKVDTIIGGDTLWCAKNCFLEAKTINGNCTLRDTEGCIAEIINYQGGEFGVGMKNGTIYSPYKKVLQQLKQADYVNSGNKFELKS